MYEGGYKNRPRSALVFRCAGLLIPILLLIYGVLAQQHIIKVNHSIDNYGFLIFAFWWIFISALQFLLPSKTKLESILRLIAYHLLAGSYLVFISGIISPFTAGWIILSLVSYMNFPKHGLQFSILALAIFISADLYLCNGIDSSIIIYEVGTFITVVATCFVIISVLQYQEISRKELSASKAQESLQRDRVLTIINNLSDAVLSTDMDGIVRVYNAASLDLLDTNSSPNGQHINDILPLFDSDNNSVNLFEEFTKAKTVTKRDDLNFVFDGDDKMRLELTFSPIRSSYSRSKRSETHDGYIVIMRDVTKAKSLEEERDEFISVISHELRTPITIAEGTISNVQMMMEHPDITHAMLNDALKVAHDQVIFLAGMVNDLSTLSRAERGVADNAEDINVRELAHNLHKKYADDAKAKKLHLDLDLSAKLGNVHVSRLYLEEMMQDFITNALKYTQNGSVTIGVKQKNSMITFSVKDTGIGVSKSDQAKLFNKFYRSEDYRTRETGGTGLGLYIATKLAHKLGTQIKLTSRLNFGSTFSFTLPESK